MGNNSSGAADNTKSPTLAVVTPRSDAAAYAPDTPSPPSPFASAHRVIVQCTATPEYATPAAPAAAVEWSDREATAGHERRRRRRKSRRSLSSSLSTACDSDSDGLSPAEGSRGQRTPVPMYDFSVAPASASAGGSGGGARPLDRYIAQSYGRADAHLTHSELLAVMHDLQQRLSAMHRAQQQAAVADALELERFQKGLCRKCCY